MNNLLSPVEVNRFSVVGTSNTATATGDTVSGDTASADPPPPSISPRTLNTVVPRRYAHPKKSYLRCKSGVGRDNEDAQ